MRNSRVSFFFVISIIGVMAVLIGFAKTFFIPIVNGAFVAPPIIHIHGFFAFAWVLLFFTQNLLIQRHKINIHRKLGYAGIAVAGAVAITMVPVGMYVVSRDLSSGVGESSYSTLIGIITSGLMFFGFVLAGIIQRKNSRRHKRLLLLATIIVLWPAWFRFRHYFPSIPRPDIWFAFVLADSLIVVAWIWDKMQNGKIHRALLYGGLFIILEQAFEIIAFDSPAWRSTAKSLYALFG